MKRRKKFKKNWLIACVSALVLTAVGGVLALLFLPSAPESNEPKKLEKPMNFEYTMNLTIKDKKTEHLLSWDIVNKATGYKIEIQREESEIVIEKQVDKYTQEYDITNYVISDENYSVKITAVGDEDYLSSETTEMSLKIETATAGLSFRVYESEYEVSSGDADEATNIVIPDTFNGSRVKKISDWGFGWNGVGLYAPQPYLESIRLPKNLEEIGEQSFRGCINLGKIVIPDSVVTIGFNAFADCKKLQTKMPSNLKKIGDFAFINCASLENVELPKNLEYIGDTAFRDTNFTKIVIPDSVKYIGLAAFGQMLPNGASERGLETVEYSENLRLEFMGNSAFDGTIWYKNQPDGYIRFNDMLYCYKGELPENTEITSFPEGITKLASGVFEKQKNLVSITIPEGFEALEEDSFRNCESLTIVNLPNSLKRIGVNAFRDCESLEEIILPNGLEEIGACAFSGTSIVSIGIPDGVKVIGEAAFWRCKQLGQIVLPANLKILPQEIFSHCEKLSVLEIPEGVEKIEYGVIYKTAIESVIVPKSVKEMDIYAFDNEKTKAVYYEGSKEDWENITRFGDDFSDYIEYHVPPVYYYSETEPTTEGNYWYYDENGLPKVWEYQGE